MFEDKNEIVKDNNFSEEDQQQFQIKLWELLKWQAGKYNSIDSTSMPIEKAQDLLASLMYTICLVAAEEGITMEELLQRDFHEVIKAGQELLDYKRKTGLEKWEKLCLTAPQIGNVYYVSTIKSLGDFFKNYEIYYAAHEIPCSIDYSLLKPIPDDLQGISFIEEYIRRISIENSLVVSFPFEAVIEVLHRVTADYKEDYLNLCEPVLISAIGRIILGHDLSRLDISEEDVEKLRHSFLMKTKDEIKAFLSDMVDILGREKGIAENLPEYFKEEIESLAIRIDLALKSGSLTNIFYPKD